MTRALQGKKEVKRSSAATAAEQRHNKKQKNVLKKGFMISADTAFAPPQPAGKRKELAKMCSCLSISGKDDWQCSDHAS